MAGSRRIYKSRFHLRVYLAVLSLCWLTVGIFMVFQYHREKEYRQILLDTQLQARNEDIIRELGRGLDPAAAVANAGISLDDFRVTLIDASGRVIYDNNTRTPYPTSNHNGRPEVMEARAKGKAHSVARHSESDNETYFYSAMLGPENSVVRIAVPYTHGINEFLRADSTIIWIMLTVTAVMSLVAYLLTRKISMSISRLDSFARRAEEGGKIFEEEAFPDDELGSIASHIVRLYVQRDRRHEEALAHERDKIRIKRQLTNNINHELKTPVASILSNLELIEEHPDIPEKKKKEIYARVYANAQRLSALLKDVSDITRMDEGSSDISMEPLDLTEIVRDTVEDMKTLTDMRIIADIPPLKIKGNRHLIESIFRNLISNAIFYSGGTEISITADSEGNFTLRDNGCGVPEEHLPHIFERFYRVEKGRSRALGGTGLGLSIVKNAVAIHGGEIHARNDGGLIFTFTLPPVRGVRYPRPRASGTS